MSEVSDPPLSRDEISALRRSCGPLGVLAFLPADALLTLRRLNYVEIVLGGARITPLGLARLTREDERGALLATARHPER